MNSWNEFIALESSKDYYQKSKISYDLLRIKHDYN